MLHGIIAAFHLQRLKLHQDVKQPRAIALKQIAAHQEHVAQPDLVLASDLVENAQVLGIAFGDDLAGQVPVLGMVAAAVIVAHGAAHYMGAGHNQVDIRMSLQPRLEPLRPCRDVQLADKGFHALGVEVVHVQKPAVMHQPQMGGLCVVLPGPIERGQLAIGRIALRDMRASVVADHPGQRGGGADPTHMDRTDRSAFNQGGGHVIGRVERGFQTFLPPVRRSPKL